MDAEETLTHENNTETVDVLKRTYSTPAQDKQLLIIRALESRLNSEMLIRDSGLNDKISEVSVEATKKQLQKAKQLLKKMYSNAIYQSKHRNKLKRKQEDLDESLGHSTNKKVAKPRIEDEQPGILEALIRIAIHGSAVHDRRRDERIKICKTLSDIHDAITNEGYKISRSALHLRFVPKNYSTIEGRRHVKIVPIKLCRAQNDMHKVHPDTEFCVASIRYVEELASFLGANQTGFISQDDKARVPIGLTVAQKQSPLLMHLEYRVRLMDHDWVIAERHKLIPSVYAGIAIKPDRKGPEAVSYSGPTYIGIRSGKHSSSTAASHAQDFLTLLELDEFDSILKFNNEVKPVLIFSVDGGPDENPR